MDKSFDGVLDAVSNGRFLLIGMQKKKKSERVRDILLKYNQHIFSAIAGQCWLPRMLKSCNFSSAIFFPFGDENLKIPRPWLTRSFHVAQRIRGGLICLCLETRIGPIKYFFRKKKKENVDLCHATNDTQVEGRVVAFVSRWIFHHVSLRHHLEVLRPRPSNLPALPFCLTDK